MHGGYVARQRVTTAVHSKLLRLSGAAAARVGPGSIVNLASSDVRRLEDVGPFWPFLFAAPLETVIIAVLLAARLGAVPALAGVAPVLAFVPLQGALSRRIGGLRRATAACTDKRARVLAEAVHGALAVKMLGLEPATRARVDAARAAEAVPTLHSARIRALNMALFFLVFPLSCFFMFAAVAAGGASRRLSVADVFFALSLLRLPQLYVAIFFLRAVETTSELVASLARLDAFLATPEPPPPPHAAGGDAPPPGVAIAFRGCDFEWPPGALAGDGSVRAKTGEGGGAVVAPPPPSSPSARASIDAGPPGPALSSVSLDIAQGELVGIAGAVGSGKSALLLSLLAELDAAGPPSTHPLVRGTVSYCAQTPWIMSGTVRANVVDFGVDDGGVDETRYAAALAAAALTPDIARMPGGDGAEIGERGVNMSGGQRARVALARAAFARADVALLDDPLSALDSRVAETVFAECIGPGSMLDGTTRLLATHAVRFLPRCDRVIILRRGAVAAVGRPADLAAWPELAVGAGAGVSVDAAAAVAEAGVAVDAEPAPRLRPPPSAFDSGASPAPARPPPPNDAARRLRRDLSGWMARGGVGGGGEPRVRGPARALSRFASALSSLMSRRRSGVAGGDDRTAANGDADKTARREGALTTDELRSSGSVSLRVYIDWARRLGVWPCAAVASFMVVGQCAYLFVEYWASTLGSTPGSSAVLGSRALGRDIPPGTWLTVYGGLTAAIVVVALARAAIFFEAAVRAATAVHADAAAAVMRAPLSFFHTTPAGRILNRFTKDQVRAKGGERGAGGLARGRPVPRPRRRNPSPPSPPLSSSGHHG